jgi:hypothetical protein
MITPLPPLPYAIRSSTIMERESYHTPKNNQSNEKYSLEDGKEKM